MAISAARQHTCALLDDQTVKCWGRNDSGKLGRGGTNTPGRPAMTPDTVAPVNLGPGRTAKAISAGGTHTCALLDDRSVRCWGEAGAGQLGYGNTEDIGDDETPGSAGPVDVGAGRTVAAISAGDVHTCARLDDGSVRCWGFGAFTDWAIRRRAASAIRTTSATTRRRARSAPSISAPGAPRRRSARAGTTRARGLTTPAYVVGAKAPTAGSATATRTASATTSRQARWARSTSASPAPARLAAIPRPALPRPVVARQAYRLLAHRLRAQARLRFASAWSFAQTRPGHRA